MELFSGLNPEIVNWVLLPIFIFLARVIDVSLGTLRIIFSARGRRYLAPALGFIETFIWIVAIGQIVRNLTNPASYLAYAAGFAVGNLVGILIEEKLALGTLAIRIFATKDAPLLVEQLHEAGFGATTLDAQGSTGPVKIVFSVIKRKDIKQVVNLVRTINPKAFFSIEEVRAANEGVFPMTKGAIARQFGFSSWRKRK